MHRLYLRAVLELEGVFKRVRGDSRLVAVDANLSVGEFRVPEKRRGGQNQRYAHSRILLTYASPVELRLPCRSPGVKLLLRAVGRDSVCSARERLNGILKRVHGPNVKLQSGIVHSLDEV